MFRNTYRLKGKNLCGSWDCFSDQSNLSADWTWTGRDEALEFAMLAYLISSSPTMKEFRRKIRSLFCSSFMSSRMLCALDENTSIIDYFWVLSYLSFTWSNVFWFSLRLLFWLLSILMLLNFWNRLPTLHVCLIRSKAWWGCEKTASRSASYELYSSFSCFYRSKEKISLSRSPKVFTRVILWAWLAASLYCLSSMRAA